jgi:hypothetical protein
LHGFFLPIYATYVSLNGSQGEGKIKFPAIRIPAALLRLKPDSVPVFTRKLFPKKLIGFFESMLQTLCSKRFEFEHFLDQMIPS